MARFKTPKPKELRRRLREIIDIGLRKDNQKFALWCPNCDYLYFPYRKFPKVCPLCKQYIKWGWHRVNKDGKVTIHFSGQKTLKEAFE
ncbi:hypothetical protein CEE45_11025 [Candidatus Heimdallarchaeota archaeon B3_Heim]|nr:MAG: hypothetical protein CEE45_11025 [Candidatus Heimdallarchaeota archaeon B3_Heim]